MEEKPSWDDEATGVHLVTLVTRQRQPLLGRVANGEITLSDYGRIVAEEWQRAAHAHPRARADEFVVMPNHLHALLWLDRPGGRRRRRAPAVTPGCVITPFKAAVSRRTGTARSPIWQPGYRHLPLRDGQELEAIRRYIRANPAMWETDVENQAPPV